MCWCHLQVRAGPSSREVSASFCLSMLAAAAAIFTTSVFHYGAFAGRNSNPCKKQKKYDSQRQHERRNTVCIEKLCKETLKG